MDINFEIYKMRLSNDLKNSIKKKINFTGNVINYFTNRIRISSSTLIGNTTHHSGDVLYLGHTKVNFYSNG